METAGEKRISEPTLEHCKERKKRKETGYFYGLNHAKIQDSNPNLQGPIDIFVVVLSVNM